MSVSQRFGLVIKSLGRFPYLISLVVFSLICLIYAVPLLKNLTYWGEMDWDQFVFWNAVPRLTILKYHQFPLWNPYSNGGNVMLALPHSSFLSPMFIFVLLFGPVIGLKVQWIVSLFIGLWGMFFLSRHFKMAPISQYLAPIIFMLSSSLTLHMAEGHVEFIALAFLPWFILFAMQAHQNTKCLFLSVIFLSLMVFSGVYVPLFTIIFSIFYFLLETIREKKFDSLISLGLIFLLAFCLSSIKLIPGLMFLKQNPRTIESREATGLSSLPVMLLSRDQGELYQNTKRISQENRVRRHRPESGYGWHEYGAYVGLLPLILAGFGMMVTIRQYWPLLMTSLLTLWLALGGGAFYNLWDLIHKMPIFDSLHVPTRFLPWVVFTLSLFAGWGLSKVENTNSNKIAPSSPALDGGGGALLKREIGAANFAPSPAEAGLASILTLAKYCVGTWQWPRPGHARGASIIPLKFFVMAITLFVFLDLISVNYPVLKNTFTIKPPIIQSRANFEQRHLDFNLFPGRSVSSMYPAVLSNSGVLNSYDIVNVPQGGVRIEGAPDYRGEVYFMNPNNSAKMMTFSPNKVTVRAEVQEAGSLILNQNYDPGWRVAGYSSKGGPYAQLVSTYLPAGHHSVVFYYYPFGFVIGTGLTILTFVVMMITSFAKRPLKGWVSRRRWTDDERS